MKAADHRPQQLVTAGWAELLPGARLTIVKLAPDGGEAAQYPGEVAVGLDNDFWIVVRAIWTHRVIVLDGLALCPGDELLEWFSPRHWFNAFAVYSAKGQHKGWYANVTHPARLDVTTDPPVLIWHDLYVDLVGLPNSSFTIRDDDELLASGLADTDTEGHERILDARAEMIFRFQQKQAPFVDLSDVAPGRTVPEQNAPVQ